MTSRTLILGAGPGFGQAIANAFGQTGQAVTLVARHAAPLQPAVEKLQTAGITADYVVADVSDPQQVQVLFANSAVIADLTTVVYNVGITRLDDPLHTPLPQIEQALRTNVLGAIAVGHAISHLSTVRNFLVTGGGAALHPSQITTTLSLTKAALRSYVLALNAQLSAQDIYVGLITIQGIAGVSVAMQPANVAQAYVQAAQDRQAAEIFYPQGQPVATSEFDQLKQLAADPVAMAKLLTAHPEFKAAVEAFKAMN